jgi:hypothetical protein
LRKRSGNGNEEKPNSHSSVNSSVSNENQTTVYENNSASSLGIMYHITGFFSGKNKSKTLSSTTITSSEPSWDTSDHNRMLKIRNDLSKNINDEFEDSNTFNIYSTVIKSKKMAQTEAQKNCFNSAFEVSTIQMEHKEESSDDQGIYCIATGLSTYSLSSNFSSVTNSHCCDATERDLSCDMLDTVDRSGKKSEQTEKTRLSLFEMTPRMKPTSGLATSHRQEIMNEWIVSNYNNNCQNAQVGSVMSNDAFYERNYKSFLIASQTTSAAVYSSSKRVGLSYQQRRDDFSSANQIDSKTECII